MRRTISMRHLLMFAAVALVLITLPAAAGAVQERFEDDPLFVDEQPIIPQLTDEEAETASNLATDALSAQLDDKNLQSLLHDSPAIVQGAGVWHTHDLRKLGAAVEVELPRPVTITANFPLMTYDETEKTDPPYKLYSELHTVEYAQKFIVMVDLRSKQVVSIVPAPTEDDLPTSDPIEDTTQTTP